MTQRPPGQSTVGHTQKSPRKALAGFSRIGARPGKRAPRLRPRRTEEDRSVICTRLRHKRLRCRTVLPVIRLRCLAAHDCGARRCTVPWCAGTRKVTPQQNLVVSRPRVGISRAGKGNERPCEREMDGLSGYRLYAKGVRPKVCLRCTNPEKQTGR